MITIPHRFRGPARSGNGGYTAGLLAGALRETAGLEASAPITVTLRTPPPLDTPMDVSVEGTGADAVARLVHGETLVAEARAGEFSERPPPLTVDYQTAVKASDDYPGFTGSPFPGCFTCGPERTEGDGLRIFPGPVSEGTVAAPWEPIPGLVSDDRGAISAADHGAIPEPVVWAALDCPGGWSVDLVGRPMVLGRITAQVTAEAAPQIGARYVIVGQCLDTQERKAFTASALYDEDGMLLGRAEATWIAVDPAVFNTLRGT